MREYLLTILIAAVGTYLLTPVVRLFAVWFGAQAKVRDRDVHAIPTPRMGGLAMFGGMLAAVLIATRLPKMSGVLADSGVDEAMLAAGALIVVLGIVDDRWEIDALTKFAGQVAAGGILIMNGIQLLWLPTIKGDVIVLPPAYSVPLTVFLVVATINAVNFVDGLDGLAAGVVGIAAIALFSYAYLLSAANNLNKLSDATLTAAILIGMTSGFLLHNFNPARIFMGDTGSMLIGLLLSSAAIKLTELDPAVVGSYKLFPVFVTLLLVPAVVAVPFIDMSLAVWRRTNQGRSPFAPDKQHLHHRLLELGHSHRRAVLIMYFWVGLLASCVVGLSLVGPMAEVLSLEPGMAMTVVLAGSGLAAIIGLVVMIGLPRLGRRKAAAPKAPAIPAERPRLPV